MQNKVKEFNENCGRSIKPMNEYARLIDIQSELGELAKEYLKASNYGDGEFKISEDFEIEFGDVMYSMLSLANETGINANNAVEKVLKKYQERINKKKSMGSEY